ncbi:MULTISPECIES: hypothetical protein [unclassified Mycobacteroides]|nr:MULTISPECIES: hypothetical protein [unclassified Mycobacteroides]
MTKKADITPYTAGEVLAHSVIWYCPKHLALLKKFIDHYKGGRQA